MKIKYILLIFFIFFNKAVATENKPAIWDSESRLILDIKKTNVPKYKIIDKLIKNKLPDKINGITRSKILAEAYIDLKQLDNKKIQLSQYQVWGLEKKMYNRWLKEYGKEIFKYREFLTLSNDYGLSIAHILAFNNNFSTQDEEILSLVDVNGLTVAHVLALNNKDWNTYNNNILKLKTKNKVTVESLLKYKKKLAREKREKEIIKHLGKTIRHDNSLARKIRKSLFSKP